MITKNNKQTKCLKIGDKIKVLTIFGYFNMIYKGKHRAYTKNNRLCAVLFKNKEGFWDSRICFDPEVIIRVKVV